jgi:hypothetical protein
MSPRQVNPRFVYFPQTRKRHIAKGSSTLCGLSLNVHKAVPKVPKQRERRYKMCANCFRSLRSGKMESRSKSRKF